MVQKRMAEAIWIEAKSYWQVKVQKDGIRRAFTSSIKGRKGKHAAEAKADEWLEKGTQDMRFPAAWEAFLADQKARTGTANWAKHESNGRLYIVPIIGNKRISAITPVNWQTCIDTAAQNGLSRRTCKNLQGSISAFLHYAKRARWDVQMLEDGDLTVPNSAAPAKAKKILQPDDIKTLFTDDKIIKWGKPVVAHYIYAWRLFVVTGLRRGELCGLKNEDISDGYISVKRSINQFLEETYGKNDNARRSIMITPSMQKILDDQRAYLRGVGIISPWVFPDEHGEMANPKSIADRWRFYCKQHGFETTIHELRHTFISINKADLPIELMKSVVGHSSSMDTYGIYGHDVAGDDARAAEIIEGVFSKVLGEK